MRSIAMKRATASRFRFRLVAASARAFVCLGMAGGIAGCGSIEPVAPVAGPVTDPAQLYMGLTLDHPAVTLSTAASYNTLQLTATPRDALGNPMTGLPTPTFTSSDTTTVRVTADGLVTAVGVGTGIQVAVILTSGPVSHVDTARINVTSEAAPPALASLSIDPVAPESSVWPLRVYNFITALLLDNLSQWHPPQLTPVISTAGGAVAASELQIAYTSLDSAIAAVDRWTGSVRIKRVGQVLIVARTTFYGVTTVDTATFTVTPFLGDEIAIMAGPPTGAPTLRATLDAGAPGGGGTLNAVHIVPGGFVLWYSFVSDPLAIEFDDPTNVVEPTTAACTALSGAFGVPASPLCGAGDLLIPGNPDPRIPENGGTEFIYTLRMRQFPMPGVYPFHISGTNLSAKIVVGEP